MKITARLMNKPISSKHLLVKSNVLGALHLANSITVRLWDDTFGIWSHDAIRYHTITEFLIDWRIEYAQTRHIKIPFLRRHIGLGDAFAVFAERLPLSLKMRFNGCIDRREWWNWLVQFTPFRRSDALLSQAVFDSVMDIRRALRERGENPFDYNEAPKCDICSTWVATHVIRTANGMGFIVCDKPKCQDRIVAALEMTDAHV